MHRLLTYISLLLLSISCNNKYESKSCLENPGQGKLFVFIGKKIEVKAVPSKGWDAKFLARYKILERICGDFRKDTIEFTVYDHYGTPTFANYENAMLFVVEDSGKFYHEKYQFFDVYKTRDGRWASPSSWYDQYFGNKIPPEKIDFVNEVSFSVSGLKKQAVKERFPQPYYRISDNKAIAEYGHYANDLFKLKKNGILSNRGLFGERSKIEILETKLADLVQSELVVVSLKEYKIVNQKWNELLSSIRLKNSQKIKEISFDSVVCSVCEGFASDYYYNDLEPIDSFIATSFRYFPGSEQWKTINSKDIGISAIKYLDNNNEYAHLKLKEQIVVYDVTLKKELKIGKKWASYQIHTFSFIKSGDTLKFYGMETR